MSDRNPALIALGEAVRQFREQRGLTSSGLAAAAGLDLDQIEAIERGEHDPPYEELLALAHGLGVTHPTLFNRAASMESTTTEKLR